MTAWEVENSNYEVLNDGIRTGVAVVIISYIDESGLFVKNLFKHTLDSVPISLTTFCEPSFLTH